MVKTLQGVIERMGKDLDRERERVDQLTNQLTRLAERLALPAPKAEPGVANATAAPENLSNLSTAAAAPVANATPPSRLRRAWRWMRATGCLAGTGLLLALTIGGASAQQQRDIDSANFMLPHCKRMLLDTPGRGTFTEGGLCWLDHCTCLRRP
jgi:hypothetical protein